MNKPAAHPKSDESNDPKIAKAVSRGRAVRAKAAEMTPEENERHVNLAMRMIYGEASDPSPRD
jgi:hypothetical protein